MGWLAHNGDRSTVNMGPYVHTPYAAYEELFALLVARGSVGVAWGDAQIPVGHTGTGLGGTGAFALTNAWQVIEDPDGTQQCFQNLGVSGLYAQVARIRSVGGLFTGGAPSVRPTATDEVNCGITDSLFAGVYSSQYFHAVAADAAISGRWPWWLLEVDISNGYYSGLDYYGALEGSCAADADPSWNARLWGGVGYDYLVQSWSAARGYVRGVWGTVYADALHWYGTLSHPGRTRADWDGNHRTVHPSIHHGSTDMDVKGMATGLAWAPRNSAGTYPPNGNTLFKDPGGIVWLYLHSGASNRAIMLPGWPDETVCPLPDMGAGVSVVDIIIDNAPAPTPDTTAPTISVVSPTPGGPIAAAQPIVVDVTDAGGLGLVVLTVEQGTAHEVVWLRDTFAATYAASTRAAIAGGHRYTVRRAGGWTASPVFHVEAIDLAGNLGA